MASALPILNSFFIARQDKEMTFERVVVVGPTDEELAEFAPALSELCSESPDDESGFPPSANFALDATTNLRTLLEQIWERFGWQGFAFYLVLPAEVDVAKQLPLPSVLEVGRWQSPDMPEDFQTKYADFEKLRIPKRLLRSNTSGALLLSGLLPPGGGVLAVCPDSELEATHSGELLRYYNECFREERRFDERFRDSLRDSLRESSQQFKIGIPEAKPGEMWTNQCIQLVPTYLLGWSMDGTPLTLACLAPSPRLHVHTRFFSTHSADQLRSADYVASLLKIVYGHAPRTEDDIVWERDDLMLSYDWHVHDRAREEVPLNHFAGYDRFPLLRMDEFCELHELAAWPSSTPEPKTCWMPLDGIHGGTLMLAAPEQGTAERVLRITCDDPAFLLSIFADQHVEARIDAHASGSLLEPRISARHIREFEVPWPNEEERRRILRQMDGIWRALDEAAHGREDLFGDFKGTLRQFYQMWEDSDHESICPPFTLVEFCMLQDHIRERMMRLTALLAGGVDLRSSPSTKPSILAIPYRKYELEQEIAERIKQLMVMSEVLVRYDLALMMSVLHQLGSPVALSDFSRFDETLKGKSGPGTGKFIPSLGHWVTFNVEARRRLMEIVKKRVPQSLAKLCNRITAISPEQLNGPLGRVVELRNRYHGHGLSSLGMSARTGVHEEIRALFQQLSSLLAYCEDYPTWFQEKVSPTQQNVTVTFRRLCGDNPLMDRVSRQFPLTQRPDTVDHEINLVCQDERLVMISLSPWLLFRSGPASGEPVVWLLDTERGNGKWAYKSPQSAASEELVINVNDDVEIVRAMRRCVRGGS